MATQWTCDSYCYNLLYQDLQEVKDNQGVLSDHATAVIIFLALTAMALATILAIHMQDFNRLRRERDELKEELRNYKEIV